jgi:hypothetical protein
MKQGINKALQAKADKSLDIKMNYSDGGIMTRREWLRRQMIKGATVNEGTKNRIQYNRIKANRMSNHKEQEEYLKKCNEKVKCYELHLPGRSAFWEITKTEYDHFNGLLLEEDINTQKNELSEKIEAGTATDQEIDEAMNKEFEFAAKYF